MAGGNRRRFKCVVCEKRTKPKERRPISTTVLVALKQKLKINIDHSDIICNKCRHIYNRSIQSSESHRGDNDTDKVKDPTFIPPLSQTHSEYHLTSPPSVSLRIKSTPKTHSRCLVCKRQGPKLIVVPSSARISAFIDYGVLIYTGSRCCPGHIENKKLLPGTINSISTCSNTYLNRSTILALLNSMRDICNRINDRLDFEALKENEYLDLTGLQMCDFYDICHTLEGKIRNTPVRSLITTVGLFFLKLKSGMSNKLLATVFGITRSSVRRAITSVRQALVLYFVPNHLGLSHTSREEIITKHTTPLAQAFFGGAVDESGDIPKMILVLDGTYIYIQKSNNFLFQRRSFSLHKGKPLVKPMVVVTTTGYFITIVGPFFADAKNSDAKILNHMLLTNVENIKSFVQPEDVSIVDRGFRDSIMLLEDLGIKAEMPSFLAKGQSQLTTDDANSSRLVTKIRWIVESANARIKRWKYLERVLPNNQVPYIGDYVRIICAVCNKYLPPLATDSNTQEDSQIAAHMKYMSSQPNTLQAFVEEHNLSRRTAVWKQIDQTDLEDFPRMTEEQIRAFTCGVYQLKLSKSYIQEHLGGNCDIHIYMDDHNLMRVKLQSRHISSKIYMLWLKYNSTEVLSWYCKCRSGARVVGVCSHIAAMVWYLGYARYRFMPEKIGIRNWGASIMDADRVPEAVDSSDSSSEDEN